MPKEQGANKLLMNCPPCILFLEQRLELRREAGEPMECGIFDFYKVFSRAFGEEGDGAGGVRVGGGGCRDNPVFEKQVYMQLTPRPPDNHSTHRIEMAKEQGAYMPTNQLPVLYHILRKGAGVDAGAGRAYEVLLTRPPLLFNPTPCICLLDMWATASVVVVGCCRRGHVS